MKRIFFVVLCVVSLVGLMVFSAFGLETYSIDISGGSGYFSSLPLQNYTLEISIDGYVYVSEVITDIADGYDNAIVEFPDADMTLDFEIARQEESTGGLIYAELTVSSTGYLIDKDYVITFVPVSAPEPSMGFMESIGYFFTSCFNWVSQVASLIVSNPALLVISIGIFLVTFSVILFKRF